MIIVGLWSCEAKPIIAFRPARPTSSAVWSSWKYCIVVTSCYVMSVCQSVMIKAGSFKVRHGLNVSHVSSALSCIRACKTPLVAPRWVRVTSSLSASHHSSSPAMPAPGSHTKHQVILLYNVCLWLGGLYSQSEYWAVIAIMRFDGTNSQQSVNSQSPVYSSDPGK